FHCRVKILGRNVEDRRLALLASRVADEDVQAAKTSNRLVDEAVAEGLVSNVAGNRQCGSTFGFHELDDFARILLFCRQMGDRHVGALARTSAPGGAAHAEISAGYQSLAATERARAAIGRLAVIRARIHPARQSGPGLLLPAKRRLPVVCSRVSKSLRGRRLSVP